MQTNGYNSYNAASAFSQAVSMNTVGRIAAQHRVVTSFSTPGLPSDSFRRNNSFVSQRFLQPANKVNQFMKDLGSMVSSIGMISKIVSFFYPPAAAVSTVTDIAGPTLTLAAGDTTPKPVVFNTQQRYNPWIR